MRKLDPKLAKKKKYKNKKLIYDKANDTLLFHQKHESTKKTRKPQGNPVNGPTTHIDIPRKWKEHIDQQIEQINNELNYVSTVQINERIIQVPTESMGQNLIPMEKINQPSDNNCFYHAVAAALADTQTRNNKNHAQIREEMIQYLVQVESEETHHLHEQFKELRGEYPSLGNLITTRCSRINEPAGWGGVIEAQVIGNMYNIRIHIIIKSTGENRRTQFLNLDNGPDHEVEHIPKVYVYWENNHYQYLKRTEENDNYNTTENKNKKRKAKYIPNQTQPLAIKRKADTEARNPSSNTGHKKNKKVHLYLGQKRKLDSQETANHSTKKTRQISSPLEENEPPDPP